MLTPLALASRIPLADSTSRPNWSVPAPIDWMKRSLGRLLDQVVPP